MTYHRTATLSIRQSATVGWNYPRNRERGPRREPAAAAGGASLKNAAAQGIVRPDECAVVVLTGHGLKDIASARKAVGEPIVIDATLDAAMRATEQ